MDPRFNEIFTSPDNQIFKVVFFPDRIYHARYLNATRSRRYRYNVQEVRGKHDLTLMKGEVYLDGLFLTTFVRIEYRAGRLVEHAREKDRFVRGELLAWLRVHVDGLPSSEAVLKMHYDRWIDAYQVEAWRTLEPPSGRTHDFQVLDMMGRTGQITRVPAFDAEGDRAGRAGVQRERSRPAVRLPDCARPAAVGQQLPQLAPGAAVERAQ